MCRRSAVSNSRYCITYRIGANVSWRTISDWRGILTIAVSNPFDVVKHDDLRLATGCDLRLCLALEPQIKKAVGSLYGTDDAEKTAHCTAIKSAAVMISALGDASRKASARKPISA